MNSSNPFCYWRAVSQVGNFYDRRSEVRNALAAVDQSQKTQVIGPKGIGKTSFLRYISDDDVQWEHNVDPKLHVFVYVDCRQELDQATESQVLERLLEGVESVVRHRDLELATCLGGDSEATDAFSRALEKIGAKGLKVVFLLDEFESLARNRSLAGSFFDHLRALADHPKKSVAYVVASCIGLFDLSQERESLLSSPFFNIFRRVQLKLFSEDDSRHLIENLASQGGVCFPEDWMDLVLTLGGQHPFFLQMAGYYAFETLNVDGRPPENGRTAFRELLERAAHPYIEASWHSLMEQERSILADLPQFEQSRGSQEILNRLSDHCLVVNRNDKYDYFSPLLRDFVMRQSVRSV